MNFGFGMRTVIKQYLSVFTILFLSLLLLSCAQASWNQNFPDLIRHFSENGVKVDYVKPMAYYVAGADSGYALKIGDREVAVYKYDLSRTKQAKRYQMVVASGVLYLVGRKYPAMINGPFVMIDHDMHSQRKEIESIFQSFH